MFEIVISVALYVGALVLLVKGAARRDSLLTAPPATRLERPQFEDVA